MAGTFDLAAMVPGFDFLQGLMKNSSAALPAMGQWVAPTLDPKEIEKRIGELRTVQFWLEQNARLLGTTIQALEVQRMTLSTLQTMNLPMADLRDSLRIGVPAAVEPTPAPAPVAWAPKSASAPATSARTSDASASTSASVPAPTGTPAVDPLQWWGALTQQFTDLATQAIKDSSATVDKPAAPAAPSPARKARAAPAVARTAAKSTAKPTQRRTR